MSGVNLSWLAGLRLLAATSVVLAVAGCERFSTESDAPTGRSVQMVERDVESPEVFQVTEAGLWDGRPSLGGIWVAHPSVRQPERVIMRNTANGQSVIGALFRRERENPGPSLQVSSDAAAALGMLAGAPANLSVTALRREEVQVEGPAVTSAEFEAPETVDQTPLAPATWSTDDTSAAVTQPRTPAAAATPQQSPATAPSTSAQSALAATPYLQLATFNREENAVAAAEKLRGDGLTPRVILLEAQGRKTWRVIVGPATTAAERTALLEKARAQGFGDAYFVRG